METNPGPQQPVPTVCRLLCSNVLGLAKNLSDLTIAPSQYHTLLCSETLVSDMHHMSDLVALSCAREGCLSPEWWRHMYEMDMEHFTNPSLSMVVTKCCFLEFVVWDRTYVFSLYLNPDLDDWIFDCLLTNLNGCCASWLASFLFVGDLNGHHQEWLGSTTTNHHGVAAFDFAIVSGCWPDPYTWWNTWPPDDFCSWPSTGFCCSTHR